MIFIKNFFNTSKFLYFNSSKMEYTFYYIWSPVNCRNPNYGDSAKVLISSDPKFFPLFPFYPFKKNSLFPLFSTNFPFFYSFFAWMRNELIAPNKKIRLVSVETYFLWINKINIILFVYNSSLLKKYAT